MRRRLENDHMAAQGFGEKRPAPYAGNELRSVDYTNLKIDSAGRVIIPAEMRAAMLARPGDMLTARVVDGELRVVSRAWVMERIDTFAREWKLKNPGVSVVDELIAERREEARQEDARYERLEREATEAAAKARSK